ncbi:hypothetical protein B0H67DRAFT_549342 [Lasiosphaeris hirsuta]|uniref:Uncharacterized protein n=1 Tax=Lasiosphaeris hirsuta TaxID=260670 RepID=A0AA40BC90_9PEZI|nr:hypothetical protein B0H67DRAFT_549342 [Lasiosphaeris hirsuta]
MATSAPFSFKSQVPVTPPPDQHMFLKGPFFPKPPSTRSNFSHLAYEATGVKPSQTQHEHNASAQPGAAPTSMSSGGVGAPPTPEAGRPPTASNAKHNSNSNISASNFPNSSAIDPRYLTMVSRIAAYYQQRCQAVANFQQQRCQAWANMQRQKCQEMTQAAMLVVAWYIRDRIQRRHKRQKRTFRRGLEKKNRVGYGRGRVTKGETVRKWVMDVPMVTAKTTTPPSPSRGNNGGDDAGKDIPLDKEEVEFEMDKETTPDKDAQLFNIADNLIKSQMGRIDVPLLGLLSFDESDDSESEEEDEDLRDYDDNEGEEYEDDEMGDEDDDQGEEAVEEGGSKSVHLDTSSKGSRRRQKSSCAA